MKKLFLIAAKSSAGKDAITKEVSKELKIPIALSFTTRPKRSNEQYGVEYEFITKTDFEMKLANNEIIEHTSYNVATNETWYYGLTKAQLEKSEYILAIVNPHGMRQIIEKYSDKVVSILIETDDKTRLIRSLNREENPNVDEICRRYLADSKDFENVMTDYIVYNNESLENAVQKVKSIIVDEIMEECL
ncbi:MAG: hypothetical protein ACRC18_06375 [Cetobacterium sp.]